MADERIKLYMPETWSRNKAVRIGSTGAIAAVALNPWNLAIGLEVLAGYGKGVAVMIGPLWIGVAFARVRP